MINQNGQLIDSDKFDVLLRNRAFKYGDCLFETISVKEGQIAFAEDHYFRLMASMRMLRMEISMEFTFDFFINQILRLITAEQLDDARVRLTVFRDSEGLYLPDQHKTSFYIEASAKARPLKTKYEVDLFKDFYQYSGLLSTLKTNNRILNVVASTYADENGWDNCLLLNEHKNLVEAVNGNIFLVKGDTIFTPPITSGCIKGIIRKNLISLIEKDESYTLVEKDISPFELLKVDELFITNSIVGIQPVTKYRKKEYNSEVAKYLSSKLDEIRWSS